MYQLGGSVGQRCGSAKWGSGISGMDHRGRSAGPASGVGQQGVSAGWASGVCLAGLVSRVDERGWVSTVPYCTGS